MTVLETFCGGGGTPREDTFGYGDQQDPLGTTGL